MTDTLSIWLIGLPVLVCVLCLMVSVLVYRSARILVVRTDEQMHKLEKQMAVVTKGGIGVGQRLLTLEQKLRALQAKHDDMAGGDNFAYSQAMQMFKQGADIATVASNCGFSSSEAELMALVQQQLTKSAKSTHDEDA